MKRITYFFASFITVLAINTATVPRTASAEPSTTVTLTQTILPPSCYDTVTVTEHSTDYIAVWDCEIQRP